MYNGTVLTEGYLSEVRKQHHETIHLHLEREVTKIPADTLACDVLYKEGKSLCCYRGRPIFKGLVSGLDPAGCVRVLFRVVTDPQDQFDAAIEAFLKTLDEYGQPQPHLFYTDNPSGDVNYFIDKIPSLRFQQDKYDALAAAATVNLPASNDSANDSADEIFPQYPFDEECVNIAEDATDIDGHVAVFP